MSPWVIISTVRLVLQDFPNGASGPGLAGSGWDALLVEVHGGVVCGVFTAFEMSGKDHLQRPLFHFIVAERLFPFNTLSSCAFALSGFAQFGNEKILIQFCENSLNLNQSAAHWISHQSCCDVLSSVGRDEGEFFAGEIRCELLLDVVLPCESIEGFDDYCAASIAEKFGHHLLKCRPGLFSKFAGDSFLAVFVDEGQALRLAASGDSVYLPFPSVATCLTKARTSHVGGGGCHFILSSHTMAAIQASTAMM
jgi:hypothetical protein